MLAPVAIQQGRHLAANIRKLLNNKPLVPFSYNDKGTMATVGRNRAVVDLPSIKFSGILAWFAWMYLHLLFLVGFRNKMVVFVNWAWNYFTYDRGVRLILRRFQLDKGTPIQAYPDNGISTDRFIADRPASAQLIDPQ